MMCPNPYPDKEPGSFDIWRNVALFWSGSGTKDRRTIIFDIMNRSDHAICMLRQESDVSAVPPVHVTIDGTPQEISPNPRQVWNVQEGQTFSAWLGPEEAEFQYGHVDATWHRPSFIERG